MAGATNRHWQMENQGDLAATKPAKWAPTGTQKADATLPLFLGLDALDVPDASSAPGRALLHTEDPSSSAPVALLHTVICGFIVVVVVVVNKI